MSECLFCNGPEKAYTPSKHFDFVCSTCVQLILNADQDDLKRAHAKAIEKGYCNKATAIKMFLIEENENDQRKPKTRKYDRYPNRNRIVRPARNKKKRIERIKV